MIRVRFKKDFNMPDILLSEKSGEGIEYWKADQHIVRIKKILDKKETIVVHETNVIIEYLED